MNLSICDTYLGRLHHVALDLQLACHEQLLRLRFACDHLLEVGVGERKND